MLLSFRNLFCWSMLAFFQAPSTAPLPPGGKPLPWAAVSIHVTPPDAPGGNWGDDPNGVTMHGVDMRGLISQAYAFSVMPMPEEDVIGLPDWAKTTRYDVVARVDPDDVEAFKKLSNPSMEVTIAAFSARQTTAEMMMLQQMLTERFGLKVHWETRDRTVFNLELAKGGLRMKPASNPEHGEMSFSSGHLVGKGIPFTFLADLLSQPTGRTVVDKTGLKGSFDFDLHFKPELDKTGDSNSTDPDLFTAVQEQLGLKLQGARAPVPVIVVDHVEQPTAN